MKEEEETERVEEVSKFYVERNEQGFRSDDGKALKLFTGAMVTLEQRQQKLEKRGSCVRRDSVLERLRLGLLTLYTKETGVANTRLCV